MRPRPLRALAVLAAAAGLAGCGAPPALAHAPMAGAASPSAAPTPLLRLAWRVGDSFQATMDQQLDAAAVAATPGAAPVAIDLAMTSRQRLSVQSVADGTADLQVSVTSWGWRRSGAYQRFDQLPSSWHVLVGPDGSIRSGRYWGMAQEPPLPGVDFFSAGLPGADPAGPAGGSGAWQRRLEDGTALLYEVKDMSRQPSAPGQTTVQATARYQLDRRAYTADAQPELVQGSAQAVIRSAFDTGRGRLLSTSYTCSFTVRETGPLGTTMTRGSVVTTVLFQYP